ncbi:proprotein convertase P-domain-containing protein [Thermodesulfobacteriota bacterium]
MPTFVDTLFGGDGEDRVLFLGGDTDSQGRVVPDFVSVRYNRILHRYEFTALKWDTANQEYIIQTIPGAVITAKSAPPTIDGRLAKDVDFQLKLGSTTYNLTVAKSETDGILTAESAPVFGSNSSYKSFRIGVGELAPATITIFHQAATIATIDQLVAKINDAIKQTNLINKIKAYDNGSGMVELRPEAILGGNTITVSAADGAADDLAYFGFTDSAKLTAQVNNSTKDLAKDIEAALREADDAATTGAGEVEKLDITNLIVIGASKGRLIFQTTFISKDDSLNIIGGGAVTLGFTADQGEDPTLDAYKQTYIFYQTHQVEKTVIDTRGGDDVVHGDPEYKFPNIDSEWGIDPGDEEQGGDISSLVIYGGDGDDKLFGGAYDDEIYGGAGIDFVAGGGGADYIDGGAGADLLAGDTTTIPDDYELVTVDSTTANNDSVGFAAMLPEITNGTEIDGLSFHEGDLRDWYIIKAPDALKSLSAAHAAQLALDMISVKFDRVDMTDLFNTYATTGKYLFAAQDVNPGEGLEIIPIEQFDGVPDYYLLQIINVQSFRVSAVDPAIALGQLTSDATINISLDGAPAISVTIAKADTNANISIDNLVADLNDALAAANLDTILTAEKYDIATGERISLVSAYATSIEITFVDGNAAAELGFRSDQSNIGRAPEMGRYKLIFSSDVGNSINVSGDDADTQITSDDLAYRPAAIRLGDINGDGFDDFIAAIKDNLGNGSYSYARIYFGSNVVDDLNFNGEPQAATANLELTGTRNDLQLLADDFSAKYNGVTVEFVDDGTVTDNSATVNYYSGTKTLTININSADADPANITKAATVETAIDDANTADPVAMPFTASLYTSVETDNDGSGTVSVETFSKVTAGGLTSSTLRLTAPVLFESSATAQSYFADVANVNGDAYDDIIVTVTANNGSDISGLEEAVYVIFGQESWPEDFDVAGQADITLIGQSTGRLATRTLGNIGGDDLSIELTGTKNDLLIIADTQEKQFSGITVDIQHSAAYGNNAGVSYDSVTKTLTVIIEDNVTQALTIRDAINTANAADSAAMPFTAALTTMHEADNDGSGTVTPQQFTNVSTTGFDDLIISQGDKAYLFYGKNTDDWPDLDLINADFSDNAGAPDYDGFILDGVNDGLWHLSIGRGADDNHTADDSIYYGLGESATLTGNYDEQDGSSNSIQTTGWITSGDINLAGLTSVSLTFKYFLATEGLPTQFDQATVLVSTDNFATPADDIVASNITNLTDPTSGWQSASINLNSYIGFTIKIRFKFDSVDENVNTHEGWYVDDVKVRASMDVTTDKDAEFTITGLTDVAGIGDFDNNDYDDLAFLAADNGVEKGDVYVFYGQNDKFAGTKTEADRDNIFQAASVLSGYKLVSVGNVNSDDYDDFVITSTTGSYLVLGPGAFVDLESDSVLDSDSGSGTVSENVFTDVISGGLGVLNLPGLDNNLRLGSDASNALYNGITVELVHSDGFGDTASAAFTAGTKTLTITIENDKTRAETIRDAINAEDTFSAAYASDFSLRRQLVWLGDINGDEIDDLGALALEESPKLAQDGSMVAHSVGQVFLGKSGFNADSLKQPDLVFELDKSSFQDTAGAAITGRYFASVGNINGDKNNDATPTDINDLVLAENLGTKIHIYYGVDSNIVSQLVDYEAPDDGADEDKPLAKVYVYELATPYLGTGSTAGHSGVDISDTVVSKSLHDAFALEGNATDEGLAYAQTIGDFDGDGIDDILVSGTEQSYIFLGPVDINGLNLVSTSADFIIDVDTLGSPARRMGDIDADGRSDLAFIRHDDARNKTVITVILGGRVLPRDIELAALDPLYVRTIELDDSTFIPDNVTVMIMSWSGHVDIQTGRFYHDLVAVSSLPGSANSYGYIFSGDTIKARTGSTPIGPGDALVDLELFTSTVSSGDQNLPIRIPILGDVDPDTVPLAIAAPITISGNTGTIIDPVIPATGTTDSNTYSRGTALDVDFNPGLEGFVVDSGLWHYSTGRSSDGLSGHTPSGSIYFGQYETATGGGNFNAGTVYGSITSAAFDTTGYVKADLSFNYFLQTENSNYYDEANVWISADGGATFNRIITKSSLVKNSGSWQTRTYSFAPGSNYLNKKSVKIRFEFNSRDSILNNYEGWYIDDVKFKETSGTTFLPISTWNPGYKAVSTINKTDTPADEYVAEVTVSVDLNHALKNYIYPYLVSPAGRYIYLGSFTDQGNNNYTLTNTLTQFNGENPNGDWRLEIYDYSWSAGGNLNKFDLTVKTAPAATTEFDLTVPASGPDLAGKLTDLNVFLNITHPRVNHLTVSLVSPDPDGAGVLTGTEVELFSEIGGYGRNFSNTVISTGADTSINSAWAPYTGIFKPVDPTDFETKFNGLTGNDLNGTWKLKIKDKTAGFAGTLNDWSMTIRTDAPTYSEIEVSNMNAGTTGITDVDVAVDITRFDAEDLDVYLISPENTRILLFSNKAGTGAAVTLDDEAGSALTGLSTDGRFKSQALLSGVFRLEGKSQRPAVYFFGTLNDWSLTISPTVSTLEVSDLPESLTDVNVSFNVTHANVNELDVYLISAEGTRVELFTDIGSGANFGNSAIDTTLDDEAAVSITAGTAPFTGVFKPENANALSAFDLEDPNGTWMLEITDDTGDLTGKINSWSLTFSFKPENADALQTAVGGDINGDGLEDLLFSATGFEGQDSLAGWTYLRLGQETPENTGNGTIFNGTGLADPTTFATATTAAGNANVTSSAVFEFAGDDNNLRFDARSPGSGNNDVLIKFIWKPSIVSPAEASFDATGNGTLTIFIKSSSTTADDVMTAVQNDTLAEVFRGDDTPLDSTDGFTISLTAEVITRLDRDAALRLYDTSLGGGVYALGDLNNDGYDDFAVARTREDAGDALGSLLIFKGSEDLTTGPQTAKDASATAFKTIQQSTVESMGGTSLVGTLQATGGDFNGDGKMDVLIGQPGLIQTSSQLVNPPVSQILDKSERGSVYLFYSLADNENISLVLEDADLIMEGEGELDQFGHLAYGPAIDINNDRIDDILAGATFIDGFTGSVKEDAGRIYVVYGTNLVHTMPVSGYEILTNRTITGSGYFLVDTGIGRPDVFFDPDLDGDGIPDTDRYTLEPDQVQRWYRFTTLGDGSLGNYIRLEPAGSAGVPVRLPAFDGIVSGGVVDLNGATANGEIIIAPAASASTLSTFDLDLQDDVSVTAGNEIVSYNAGTLTIKIDAGVSTANNIIDAINNEGTFRAVLFGLSNNGTGNVVVDTFNDITQSVTLAGEGLEVIAPRSEIDPTGVDNELIIGLVSDPADSITVFNLVIQDGAADLKGDSIAVNNETAVCFQVWTCCTT